jgi:hypothetical protein
MYKLATSGLYGEYKKKKKNGKLRHPYYQGSLLKALFLYTA